MLAVYPSYEFMEHVIQYMPKRPSILVEDEETRINDIMDKLKNRGKLLVNAVAGGKLTEGIEIRGREGESMIKAVLVAGIPYPQPDDYIKASMKKLAERIGSDKAWKHIYLDTAITRIKQAVGQAIRSLEDRALIVLADNRYIKPQILKRLDIKINRVITTHEEYLKTIKCIKDYIE